MRSANVVEIHEGKGALCERMLRGLPEWFGIESSIRDYAAAAETMPMFAIRSGDGVAGFLSLHRQTPATAEIHVMAVDRRLHRRGVGRALVEAAAESARRDGCRLISVKTLSPSRASDEYEKTRRFYEAMGFLPVEELKTLWGEANPCLLMVRPLAPPGCTTATAVEAEAAGPALLRAYVHRHNDGVQTGDFGALLDLFHDEARFSLEGAIELSFTGREAIARAFAGRPPTDELVIADGPADLTAAIARYVWRSEPGGGTVTVLVADGLIRRVIVHVAPADAPPT
jgi:GNAT superfamily N-acetyltransferase